jgi:hypothetical protein
MKSEDEDNKDNEESGPNIYDNFQDWVLLVANYKLRA